ncbi:MAG: hypothetical protein A3E38_00975 [Candidatus Moranbacteria bacterium RIFCSPHIGHO2_12_FULL_54_9]|nr:MAG: hypothetical protein A2878_01170 [Candidatus Moranbacteria bacterium RIFCSPHIGHO2_01_FULL_54_31]OGI24689.1 MAG: hypothetical protein A3E38_00975 [Candidatus Moranbacteria bacterium RIFCSPHIGHO2_12_FULL_54_9]
MPLTWIKTLQILLAIIIIGTALRLYDLGNNSFVSDEFLDMNSAYGYAQTGKWQAWDFNFGKPSDVNLNAPRDERAAIYKRQVATLFRFLPPTEAVARSVSVFWGAISVGVVFAAAWFLTKRREIALIAAFLFALSASGIIFDRTLRMYAMFFPLYLAAATFAYLALEQAYAGRISWCKKLWDAAGIHCFFALIAAVLFVLSLLTHQLTGTLIFSLAAYFIIRGFQEYRHGGKWHNKYAVLLTLGIVGSTTVAIFAPKFFRSFSSGLIFFDDHYGYVNYILRDYYHPLFALLLMLLGGWWIAVREGMKKESLYLSVSLLIPLAMAIWLWQRNVGAQYIFFAQAFAMILAAAGVFGVWESVREKWHITAMKKSLLVLGLLLVLVPNFGYFTEENNTYHETSSGSNPNYRKVFAYFKKNHLPTDVLVTRNVRNYYWSGANVPVYDLGDEISRTRLSQTELEKLMTEYQTGWVILSDNDYDYVGKGVKEFLNKHLTRVSNDQVRGAIDVYTWGIN